MTKAQVLGNGNEVYLTTRQTAALFGVSLRTIQLWADAPNRLRSGKTIGNHRRIAISAIKAFAETNNLNIDENRLKAYVSIENSTIRSEVELLINHINTILNEYPEGKVPPLMIVDTVDYLAELLKIKRSHLGHVDNRMAFSTKYRQVFERVTALQNAYNASIASTQRAISAVHL